MVIVFLAHLAPPRHNAGAEMMLHALLRELVDRGHEVNWLLSRETADEAPYDLDGITVIPNANLGIMCGQIQRADVVVSHLENMPRAMTLARMYAKPFVFVMHNTFTPSKAQAVEDAHAIVVNSEWMDRDFGSLPNAVIVRPPVFVDEYRVPRGNKVTLINCNENKGGLLLAALAGAMPDTEFLAVKGAYGDQVDLSMFPNVEVVDHTPNIRSVYAQTRLLLMPSAYESWGRTAVEALASGIPVLACPTPGLKESLGEAGIFLKRHDLAGWIKKIRSLRDPLAYYSAVKRAEARSRDLDPSDDLKTWVDCIEGAAA